MNIFIKFTAFSILIIFPLWAQQPTLRDSLLEHMTGNWILRGKIAGKEIIHDIEAKWVLGHQYIRIHETSREKNAGNQPEYEAEVYVGWDQAASEYICIWLDVWGGVSAQSIGRAKPKGDEIAYLFRDASNNVVFHTTFSYKKTTDIWQWVMDNDENGKLQSFARVTLTRK